jgi:hypothetical protein
MDSPSARGNSLCLSKTSLREAADLGFRFLRVLKTPLIFLQTES